jgi:phosphate transport system substrate-binding protein
MALVAIGVRRFRGAVTAGLVLGLAAGCGAGASAGPAGMTAAAAPARVTISETGSTLLFPLVVRWAGEFHREHPDIVTTAAATGSGAGIAGAAAGTADIGASDAYLSAGDVVQNPALLNVPLVVSAQQVDYNVPGLGASIHLRLDAAVLAAMYSGSIRAWNDPAVAALNPGVRLPGTPVVPVHRSDASGDTFLFTSYLSARDAAWSSAAGYGTTVAWPRVPRAAARRGNAAMVSGCAATPGCVAYIGISYLSAALAAGLGEARLANPAGQFVLPTASAIAAEAASFVSATPPGETISMVDGPAAGGYPIVNYEYAIVRTRPRSAAAGRAIRAFLRWAVTAGNSARYLGPVRFQPLPADVAALSQAQIDRIGSR